MLHVPAKHQWFPVVKIRRTKKGLVGAAGSGDDCTRLLDWIESGMAEEDRPNFSEDPGAEDEAIALMVNEDGIHCMMASDARFEKVDRVFHAIGSGSKAAMGAWVWAKKHGNDCTIQEALEIAAEVCPYTRGPFHILNLNDKKK